MNREVRQLAWFIWRHYPPAKDWGRKLLTGWVAWHYERAMTGVVLRRDGTIAAAALGRPVVNPEDGRDCYATDESGSCMFIDLAIAHSTMGLKGLLLMMQKQFGMRETIAFQRLPEQRIRIYPYRRLLRLTLSRKETT